MAYASRPTSIFPPGPSTASLRQTNSAISQQQSSALAARIASKKAELDNLIQLRDMSNDLAGQMQALQAKLETLKDGTEGELLRCRHVI
jgi:DASH complex subunit DAD2